MMVYTQAFCDLYARFGWLLRLREPFFIGESLNRSFSSWNSTSRPVRESVAYSLALPCLASTKVAAALPVVHVVPDTVLQTSSSLVLRVWCTARIASPYSSAKPLSARTFCRVSTITRPVSSCPSAKSSS